VTFVNQVSNAKAFSQREAVFAGELQHIVDGLAPAVAVAVTDAVK